jgi:hypothetical protein
MQTPKAIEDWNQKYYNKYMSLLYDLPEPQVDVVAGLVGNEMNALQGVADIQAAIDNHPPTGNEPDPLDYQERYNQLKAAITFIRRWAGLYGNH